MAIDPYWRRIVATVVALAKSDPFLVKEKIALLRKKGEIESDDLVYLERIADRWIGISKANARRGAVALAH
jgi:hypothetical protein